MQTKKIKVKTIIFLKMEDNLNCFEKGRQPQYVLKMEDDLNLFEKGRRPNFFENRRQPQKK